MTGSVSPLIPLMWRGLFSRYLRTVEALQDGLSDAVEDAIWFLERRPRFHGSGYLTERALQYVDRAPLTALQRDEIIAAAEAIVAEGRTREARRALNLLVRLSVPGAEEARAEMYRQRVTSRGY